MDGKRLAARVSLSALVIFLYPVLGFSETPFYEGKTITIINGNQPGGTADMRMRALIPYLGKYIPGAPTIVAEFMPGGGGRKVANHIYRVARPDGLTIGFPPGGFISLAVLGEPGVQYDIDRLFYLGSGDSVVHYVFLTRREAGLDSLEKLRAAPGVRIGAQSVGHTIYIMGRLFSYVLGLKDPKFVTGYSGPEVDLAVIRGETDARANLADSVLQRNRHWVEKKLVDFHAILEIPKGNKHPVFTQLPELETFARSNRERRLLTMVRAFRRVGSPYIMPPGTPRERVEALKVAVKKAFDDPAFQKDYKKLVGEEAAPLMGEQIEKAIRDLPRDPATIDLLKTLAGGDPLPPS